MGAEPTAAEIEAAAQIIAELPELVDDVDHENAASDVLAAALSLVEARLREEIAAEIEALTPRAVNRPDLHAQGWRDAVGVAARIARGKR